MTSAQLLTLKTNIESDGVLNAKPHTSDGAFDIAAAYNAPAAPAFQVWRTSVPVNEIMMNGFDWTRVDNLTVGKARIWDWMMRTSVINPSQANVRQGVLATFTAAPDAATRLAVFGHFQRAATRAEKLFATGTGAASDDQGVGPATLGFEGQVSYQDVLTARGD